MEKKNIAASARARLLNKSRETSEELQNLLMRFVAERLLYRGKQEKAGRNKFS